MEKIELNDLPLWSLWPARLIGFERWNIPSRTIEKVDQEYDKDKYARCLDFVEKKKFVTPEDIKCYEFGLASDAQICVSIGNELYKMSLQEARNLYYKLLLKEMQDEVIKCKTVVELGTGYGFNLWMMQRYFPNCRFWGGEYSINAIKIASYLYHDNPGIKVEFFNFYDEQTYKALKSLEPPLLLFTSHAIEQLPSSSVFFGFISKYREHIKVVLHFEPLYEVHDGTLLGLMRRRYTEVNDYCRDLLSSVESQDYIRVVDLRKNVLGLNPLNPTSVIRWVFR